MRLDQQEDKFTADFVGLSLSGLGGLTTLL
jgi:hypothetical protein